MSTHLIRFARETDIETLIDLISAHAAFEKAEFNPDGITDRLTQSIFSDPPSLHCLVVELESKLIGYATYMKQYSTWDAAFYIYMDCLFMTGDSRGRGIGEQLMDRIKREAEKLGCSLIQWQTPDFNIRAIKFYHRIGATSKSKERFFLEV
ncbi:MAG: GNAT family N-acetyltransferase [Calditrichia bacterium]